MTDRIFNGIFTDPAVRVHRSRRRRPEESSLCLTTERELCELFAASRGTVRRALQMLVDEGLLVRRPHHGTFIHPAVLNSAGQQKLIGLIILNGELAYWDSYILALLHGVAEGFAGTPYQVRHINFMGDPAQTIRVMATSRLSGLLWLGRWSPSGSISGSSGSRTSRSSP